LRWRVAAAGCRSAVAVAHSGPPTPRAGITVARGPAATQREGQEEPGSGTRPVSGGIAAETLAEGTSVDRSDRDAQGCMDRVGFDVPLNQPVGGQTMSAGFEDVKVELAEEEAMQDAAPAREEKDAWDADTHGSDHSGDGLVPAEIEY
jgi:hypothetical protein